MSVKIEDWTATTTEEHKAREAAITAAHEVQDEMDALCLQIKELLVASYAIRAESSNVDGVGR